MNGGVVGLFGRKIGRIESVSHPEWRKLQYCCSLRHSHYISVRANFGSAPEFVNNCKAIETGFQKPVNTAHMPL